MSAARHISGDAAAAAEACARHVVAVLDGVLAEREFASFAISGGSSPRLLFEKLAATPFAWQRVRLFWVDERCVPPTDPASNYRMAGETLIRPGHFRPGMIHRVFGEMLPEAAARRYVEDIRAAFGLVDGELPHFDLIHRGIGPDAHTASLFPGEPLIEDHQHIAAAVYVPKFTQWRVTLLPGVLMAAENTVVLALGEDKAEAVRAVFKEEYDPMRYPAQIAAHQGRGVAWFLDKKAAALVV